MRTKRTSRRSAAARIPKHSCSAPAKPDPDLRPATVRAPAWGTELPRFERLLADLSARFVNLPPSEIDSAIIDALRRIVLLLDVDRSQLVRFDEPGDDVLITHSWAVEGVARVPPKSVRDGFPWLIGRIRTGAAVTIPRLDALPSEAAVDLASFRRGSCAARVLHRGAASARPRT